MLPRCMFFLYALRLWCIATRNHSVSRVYGRGGKRPLVLHPGSQAADGLPGVRVPCRDRPRPQRRRSPSGVDKVSRGEQVGVAVPMPFRSTAVVPLWCRHVPVPDQYIGIIAGTVIFPHTLPHWFHPTVPVPNDFTGIIGHRHYLTGTISGTGII